MQDIYLEKLSLQNYRNFEHFKLECSNGPVVLIGDNGIGKTNILESISLFYPGKGLRGAKYEEICRVGCDNWQATSVFASKLGVAQLISGYAKESAKRTISFNNSKISSSELSRFINVIWLTPQMENIFYEGASHRRKFLDRMVYNFYPHHATKINEYEYYIHERAKLLQHDAWDLDWLKVLEEKIAGVSSQIAELRLKTVDQMQAAIDELDSDFPKAILEVDGTVEAKMQSADLTEISSYIQSELINARLKDRFSKRTNFGVHRSDLLVTHREKNKLAKFCSTGEQKAMLISIILAQVNAGIRKTQAKPILLLDEIFVHLDDKRKDYLINFLKTANLQVWITATDFKGIEALAKYSQVIML